jgi:hypothetical protein
MDVGTTPRSTHASRSGIESKVPGPLLPAPPGPIEEPVELLCPVEVATVKNSLAGRVAVHQRHERSLLLPRSELARRNRLAAGTGCRRQQWRRAGNRPICGSAFWRVRMPSGRVSRWPQPALFAHYWNSIVHPAARSIEYYEQVVVARRDRGPQPGLQPLFGRDLAHLRTGT